MFFRRLVVHIGKHSTFELLDGYQGSGKWVKSSCKKGNFLITGIISLYETEELAYKAEENIIEQYKNDPLCMNMFFGGRGARIGKNNHIGNNNPFFGKSHTAETKKIISKKLKDRYTKEDNPFLGKKHSKESLKKMSVSSLGIKHSLKTKKKLSEKTKGKNNGFYGKKHSIKSRKKITNSRMGKNYTDVRYKITKPGEKPFIIDCLIQWCRENNISYWAIHNIVFKGKITKTGQVAGWKVEKII